MHVPANSPRSSIWAKLLGALIGIVGLALVLGGAWLLMLGGSAYYFPAGLLLLAMQDECETLRGR